jgi:prophage tail gpP-like protein
MYKNIIGMVAGYTFAGIMLGLVTEWFDDDDDEEKVAKKLLYWSTTQYTDSVPLIGSAITDLANGVITGENGFYGDSSILVSFNKYKDAVMGYFAAGRKSDEADELEAAGQQKKAEKARKQAEAKYRRAALNFGNGVALNLGLPASGIKEIGRLFGVGDYDKDGEMDELTFNPGALFGRDPRKKEVEAEKKAEKEKKKKKKKRRKESK